MLVTTTYKLLSIRNNNANLDVIVNYTMESNISKYNITANGQGKGVMIYDIKNDFLNKYETINEIEMLFKTNAFDMIIKTKSSYNQTVEISKI